MWSRWNALYARKDVCGVGVVVVSSTSEGVYIVRVIGDCPTGEYVYVVGIIVTLLFVALRQVRSHWVLLESLIEYSR